MVSAQYGVSCSAAPPLSRHTPYLPAFAGLCVISSYRRSCATSFKRLLTLPLRICIGGELCSLSPSNVSLLSFSLPPRVRQPSISARCRTRLTACLRFTLHCFCCALSLSNALATWRQRRHISHGVGTRVGRSSDGGTPGSLTSNEQKWRSK